MTHAAIAQLVKSLTADVVLLNQLGSLFRLVVRRLPIHVENLVFGPDLLLGRFVAIQTPPHVQGMGFPGQRHLIDLAVTGRAAHPFLDMDAVVEENKIRKLVHSIPTQRLLSGQTCSDWCEHGGIGPDVRVTSHAYLCWGNPCK